MSEATKRKIVTQECVRGDVKLSSDQFIVEVVRGRGNNLHEVRTETGEITLCSMPPKFRKNVWIKKGDYLVVEKIPEGKKVTCEMVHILYDHHIKDLKDENLWPVSFQTEYNISGDSFTTYRSRNQSAESSGSDSSSSSSICGNFNHKNRPVVYLTESSSDSEEEAAE